MNAVIQIGDLIISNDYHNLIICLIFFRTENVWGIPDLDFGRKNVDSINWATTTVRTIMDTVTTPTTASTSDMVTAMTEEVATVVPPMIRGELSDLWESLSSTFADWVLW